MSPQLTAAIAFLSERYCLAIQVHRPTHNRPLPWFLHEGLDLVMIEAE